MQSSLLFKNMPLLKGDKIRLGKNRWEDRIFVHEDSVLITAK